MEFETVGIRDPQSDQMNTFRNRWLELIRKENEYLSGKDFPPSGIQAITVYMYTGYPMPRNEVGELPNRIVGQLPAQMELEAVFRARSMALAEALAGGSAQDG